MSAQNPGFERDIATRVGVTFNDLAQQGPDAVLAWLDNAESGASWAPSYDYANIWLGLTAIADHESQCYAIPQWVHVKIRILEALHHHWETRIPPYLGFLSDAIACRVGLICRYGSHSGDTYRDIQIALDWVCGHLTLPIDEVLTMADEWWINPDPEEVTGLRRIRDALYWLSALVECGQVVPDESLQAWLDIRSKLP